MADYTGDAEIDAFLADCFKTMREKGAEYTVGSPDRLANFRGVAKDAGIRMEQAWLVFANKHWRAISAYVKNDCKVQSNEPISGRLKDLLVYALLFYKMTREIERESYNTVANRAQEQGQLLNLQLHCARCQGTCRGHNAHNP